MKEKILITGIRGFVGSNLLDYLLKNSQYEITGASRERENLQFLKSKVSEICSYSEIYQGCHNFNAYVHLAGKVIDIGKRGHDAEYFKVNFEQTKKIFNRFIADDEAEKFIFLSTIHVVAEAPKTKLDESVEPKPFTAYGKSKFKAENYIVNHCPPHKKYYILRPSMIHGPGNKGNLNLLFELVKRGIPYPIGYINNQRSFVSIENLCFIINEIISQKIVPGLYHIADDEPTFTHDLISEIAKSIGKPSKMINVDFRLLKLAAKLGNILPILPLNNQRLNKLTNDFIVSNRKIKDAIGKPLPVYSKDGIMKTIRSFEDK